MSRRTEETDEADAADRQESPSGLPSSEDAPSNAGRARRHGPLRRSAKWCLVALCIGIVAVAAAVAAIEAGAVDRFLAAKAQSTLQAVLGPDLAASVAGAEVRIGSDGVIRLHAQDVGIVDAVADRPVASARAIDLDLAPLPLLHGMIVVRSLDIDGVALDPAAFGSNEPIDLDSLRVDSLDRIMDHVFAGADRFLSILKSGHAGAIRITDTRIGAADDGGVPFVVKQAILRLQPEGLKLDGTLLEGDEPGRIEATARTDAAGRHVEAISLDVTGLDSRPFLVQKSADGTPSAGIATTVGLTVSAHRKTAAVKPSLSARLTLGAGTFFADGRPADLKPSIIALDYRFDRGMIEIAPSTLRIGDSVFPFSGGIIDLSNLPGTAGAKRGFAFDLVSNDAVASPRDSDEAKLPFNGKIYAVYLKKEKTLHVKQLAISTPLGSLAGSLEIVGGGRSPEISFVARIKTMQTRAIKQLWPYWLSVHAREWLLNNLYGGTISDASIKVFVPKNEIADNPAIRLGPGQLQIDFDYREARLNIAGDIPPLRDATGHLKLRGKRLDVGLDSGTAYFPTGRKVSVARSMFSIPDTEIHPLMGDIDITVSGTADAVAELVSYDPINALQRTDFKATDFSGDVTAHVRATFGLLQQQHPPKPVWKVDADLDQVDLASKVDGHDFDNLKGTLVVDPDKAVLDTDADVDGFPMHVMLTQPLEKGNGVERQRVITATLGNAARKVLLPGLNELLSGPVAIRMTRTGEGTQQVTADLTDATVTIPGLQWTKGPGIAAHSDFTTKDDGDNGLSVDGFSLAGDGFSIAGSLKIVGGHLASASFPKVKLSPRDVFSATIAYGAKGYHVDVDASAVDLRALIEHVKAVGATDGDAGGGDGAAVTLTAKADTAYGFNNERLNGLTVSYSGRGGAVDSLDLKGVTGSGEALVATIAPAGDGQDVAVTSGDGGAVARFTDIYSKLEGGLLNLRMHKADDGPYRGTLAVRSFSVSGEGRLNSIVSSRPGSSGQSLRDVVKTPMDLNVAQFQLGSADLALGDGTLTVSNGVLRGVQIGSTFQGTVFDRNGNMNLTGTFMPAYGLNRLFADVPIIGVLLGNGRDRGLIGITFRLTGRTTSPKVEVNPLSLIAPGIFRQIFEY